MPAARAFLNLIPGDCHAYDETEEPHAPKLRVPEKRLVARTMMTTTDDARHMGGDNGMSALFLEAT